MPFVAAAATNCDTFEPTDEVEINGIEGGVDCCKFVDEIDELLLRDISNDDDDADDCDGGEREL